MNNPALALLVQAHTTHPVGRLALPAGAVQMRALFAAALEEIEIALDANDLDGAKQIVALAWRIAAQTGEPEHVARAHWCSGFALLNWSHTEALTHYTAARPYFEQAGPPEDCARVLLGYGMVLGFLGRLDAADAALAQAALQLAPQPEHPHWMRLALNRSLVSGQRGRFAAMRDQARLAATAAERHGHAMIHASALVNQGIAAMALGDLDGADAALHEALALAGEAADVGGRALVNLARLAFYRGELFAALGLLSEARTRFVAVGLEIDLATIAIEAASLYERLHLLREAREQAVFAAETFAQAGLPPESVEARLLALRLALATGRGSQITAHLEAAQPLVASLAPTWQALLRGYAAAPLLLQKRTTGLATALSEVDAATATLRNHGTVPETLDLALLGADCAARLGLPEARERYQLCADLSREHGLVALEQRACAGLASQVPPRQAIAPLRRAADLLDAQRRLVPAEELKASLLSGARTVYARLIEAQLASRQPLVAATTLIEAKGGPWADLAAPAAPTPPDNAWLAARTDLTTWQEEQRFAADEAYRTVCAEQVRRAEAALSEATRRQKRQREPQPLPTLDALRAGLRPGQAVIDYLIGATHVHACLFVCDAPPRWVRLCKLEALDAVLGRLDLVLTSLRVGATPAQRQAAAARQRQGTDALLSQLDTLLVAPLRAHLPEHGTLLIAPDERLFDLPWAALHGPAGYLGACYELLLIPSVAVLGLAPPSRHAAVTAQTGPPLALGYAGDPPLAQITNELAALRDAIPDLVCHATATLADLRGAVAPAFLHIAAHGHIRPEAPLFSQLDLADGPLLLADALNLDLHGTRLVTLSACDSGTRPERGGALLAISGAFLLAGADCALASLWPVDDAATRLLMSIFYRSIQAGASFAHALQQAQLHLRNNGYDHPIDWAAFQLIARRSLENHPTMG
ncbi:MAG: CHAT domain-containing protein [Oscillochloridaceae bacterium umkhey_bin13]